MLSKRSIEKFFAKLIAIIGIFIIKSLALSCKKKFLIDFKLPDTPVIFAFWHDELLMQPYLYSQMRKYPKAYVMISDFFAGEIIATIMTGFRLKSIRGSTNDKGGRVLLQAIKLMREGYDIAITPDGPAGPRHAIMDGIVKLAQKTKYPIVCYNYDASNKWRTDTWDKFIVPKPFSTLSFIASSPLYLGDLDFDKAKQKLHETLMKNVAKQ